MTTLADINQTLQVNNNALEDVKHNIGDIKVGILGLFSMEKSKRLDELEANREFKKENVGIATSIQQPQTIKSDDSGGGFNMLNALGLGALGTNLLAGAGKLFSLAFLSKLLKGGKRGVFGLIAAAFADEIGAGVAALTGSNFAGLLTEAGIVGGAAGLMFGPKGAILGALASGILVASNKLGNYVETELAKQNIDWAPIIGESAKGLTNIASFATIGGLALGPLGAIGGAIVAGSFSLYKAYDRYQNDPKFKELVDKKASEIKQNIENSLKAAGNLLLDTLNVIADPLITTKDEKDAFRQARPERAKLLDETQKEVQTLFKKRYDAMQPGSKVKFTKVDAAALKQSSELLKKLDAERSAFLNSGNRDALSRRGASQGGMTAEQAIEAYGTSRTSTVPATAQEMIQYVAIKRDNTVNIPSHIRSLKKGSIAQERQLATHLGISDMTKTKELAKEMNLSLIDYLEKYRTVGVNTAPIVAPITNTSIGSTSTTLVGSGTNTMDINNPNFMRAMEAGLVGR